MAAATDYIHNSQSLKDPSLVQKHSAPVRAAAVLFGFGFIWAGAGLWLVPGLGMDAEILLTKMFLSILMVTAGVGMTQIATEKPRRSLHFDAQSRQLHVAESLPRGRSHVIKSINYEEIARVDINDQRMVIYGDRGEELTQLLLDGPEARLDAVAHLRSQSLFPG